MGLRSYFANLFSKGEYSRLKSDSIMLSNRPSLARFEREAEYLSYNIQQLAYFFEDNVAVFSETIQSLRRETFRNGIRWKPRFVKKCEECGNEMQEKLEKCDSCGSAQLRDPSAAERMIFEGPLKNFKERANKNDQSLLEVLFTHDFHVNIADLGYTLILKKYVLNDDGSVKEAIPSEILTLDPRDIDFIHKPDGLPGGGDKICLKHRNEPLDSTKTVCPKCGSVLFDVHYKAGKIGTGPGQYYIEGEVLKVSKYYPSLVYGYPPIIKMADDAWTYHYIEKRVRSYYEKGRPPGLLTIPTNNVEGAKALWKEIQEEMRQDPNSSPWMFSDPEAKNTIQYLNLMSDPNPDMLEIKKELRERFGSRFGVSMIFQADTSASGGLNNEGLQITVTNRAVQWGQSIYNEKVLPWICKQFGIKDWLLELAPSEEMDEMADIQRKTSEAQWAQIMFQMGFDIEYEDEKFKISGKAKKEAPPNPFIPGQNPFEQGSPEQNEPEGSPPEQEKVEKSIDEMSHEEFVDSLFDKSFVFSNVFWLLKAIMIAPLMGRFQKLAPQEAEDLYHDMIKEMIKPERWSITDITKVLRKKFPELTDFEAERIVRTETTLIGNTARELEYREKHPRDNYVWIGPDDHRTTDICKEIKKRQPVGGLPLDGLRDLITKIVIEQTKSLPRDWKIPHIECRHTFKRVF